MEKQKGTSLRRFGYMFASSILLLVLIILIFSGRVSDEERRLSAIDRVYPQFEMYVDDFEKLKNLVVKIGVNRFVLRNAPLGELGYLDAAGKYNNVTLSLEEHQSLKNIISNSKYNTNIEIYVDEKGIRFMQGHHEGTYAGGVMYTDSIDEVRNTTNDAIEYVWLVDNWYAILYNFH